MMERLKQGTHHWSGTYDWGVFHATLTTRTDAQQ